MANFAVNNDNAAREAWLKLMNKYPKVHGILAIIASSFGYFANGHAIVAFVQWMVRVAGRIAESALLLATVYVTLNNVAHTLVSWVLPNDVIATLNYLSVVAFSLLPELIVASAIATSLDHWGMLVRNRSWKNPAWVWATLYTIPTISFMWMTVATLSSFVQIEATTGNPATATGMALTIRFLSGWGYSLVEILWAMVGKKGYTIMLDGLRAMIATQGDELTALKSTEESLRATLEQATKERDGLRTKATDLEESLRSAMGSVDTLHIEKATLINERDGLRDESERLQTEMAGLRARANRRAVSLQTGERSPMRSPQGQGYVARDDGDTISVTSEEGDTLTATGGYRDQIKAIMLRATLNNERITQQDIADEIGASKATVKKWAPSLREEIERELTGEMATIVSPQEGTF